MLFKNIRRFAKQYWIRILTHVSHSSKEQVSIVNLCVNLKL